MRRVQLQQNHHDRVNNHSTRMSPSSVRPDRVCIVGEVHHTLVMLSARMPIRLDSIYCAHFGTRLSLLVMSENIIFSSKVPPLSF
jgi:hypothetical protein